MSALDDYLALSEPVGHRFQTRFSIERSRSALNDFARCVQCGLKMKWDHDYYYIQFNCAHEDCRYKWLLTGTTVECFCSGSCAARYADWASNHMPFEHVKLMEGYFSSRLSTPLCRHLHDTDFDYSEFPHYTKEELDYCLSHVRSKFMPK